ncbi:MAG TPA: DUF72 domain-containing protein [Terriglobia bacterium]|nr:DUF72 domain-containing protein [Terriglobia bacterium]
MGADAPTIRFGPAGWSYEDWNGIVYPMHRPHGFHEAEYLSRFFDTIEINTTFYHPARAEVARSWARRVRQNPNFRFTAKLWQRFTHERIASQEDERVFKQGIEPLHQAGLLGTLLMQFPWSFKNNKENREYIGSLAMQFMEYPLVLEVRHESWNRPEIYEMLRELGVGFCNIDQPVIGRSIRPSERSTSPVGYVRLHGRNYEHWFTSSERPDERYDYLYSMSELEGWAERIRHVAEATQETYVITNNHFRGKAVANALQLISIIRGRPVQVPPTLLSEYPVLESIAAPIAEQSAPEQASFLFETGGRNN